MDKHKRMPKITTHLAQLMDQSGNVSPWCFKRPRALRLTATNKVVTSAEANWNAITCKRCKTAFVEANPERAAAITLKALRRFAADNGIKL